VQALEVVLLLVKAVLGSVGVGVALGVNVGLMTTIDHDEERTLLNSCQKVKQRVRPVYISILA